MQRAPLFPLCLVSFLFTMAACGGRAEIPAPGSGPSSDQADSGSSSSSSSSGMSQGDDASSGDSGPPVIAYDGVITASRGVDSTANQPGAYVAAAFYVAGLTGNGKSPPGCQCARAVGIALPGPVGTAGTLSLAIAGGASLGTVA